MRGTSDAVGGQSHREIIDLAIGFQDRRAGTGDARTGRLENGRKVGEHLPGLILDGPAIYLARRRIEHH